MRFDLSDDEWALLEPLMPKSRKSARADDRKIMNAGRDRQSAVQWSPARIGAVPREVPRITSQMVLPAFEVEQLKPYLWPSG